MLEEYLLIRSILGRGMEYTETMNCETICVLV